MKRTQGYFRHQRRRAINRKKRIVKETGLWYYKYEGMLAKGKIHCSCPMCRKKSYDHPKMQDLRRTVGAIQELEEYRMASGNIMKLKRNANKGW